MKISDYLLVSLLKNICDIKREYVAYLILKHEGIIVIYYRVLAFNFNHLLTTEITNFHYQFM